jgi:hypothetical protein
METMKLNCAEMESKLADLLLDPTAAPAKVRVHVEECESCQAELLQLQATMALMDEWAVPEPNPYFMTRMNARMREERQAEPAGWLARMRARFTYGPSMHVRPLAAMALAVALLVGGGAYLGVTDADKTAKPVTDAAVVNDLQTLDNNAQVLDQMESMSTAPDDSQN